MTPAQIKEAYTLTALMLTALLGTVSKPVSDMLASALRRSVGDAIADSEQLVRSATLGTALVECFKAAVAAGATFEGMDRVRVLMRSQTPVGAPGMAVARCGRLLSLMSMVTIAAHTEYPSSNAAELAFDRLVTAFASAEEAAADDLDPALYMAVVTARAACVRDLTERSRQLPRLMTYDTVVGLPALALANRLYGDATRVAELIAENNISHPAFMPPQGKALSD